MRQFLNTVPCLQKNLMESYYYFIPNAISDQSKAMWYNADE